MKRAKRIIALLAVIIPVIGLVGSFYIRKLEGSGIKVMPFSIGMCLFMAILVIIEIILVKKHL
ncbi:hypothetical protein PMSM_05360 [Paenibacillus macquariensis subsp. macquariensis]|uniref:Uncharacterized protein n=1 Tax=Paenibacillus macquariensis TaxID=948756 RepID=A0ABY1JPQ2_9BACL|nr:hypothetical protein PMSM_05360 [Paenibacillus macquariensis subsp. macquariensis]SIQ54568.1 hypothetical protein SAMN05421578_102503 [Paenibacillus macquariensis]